MMKTYSHVRRIALDQAAAALEPNFPATETRIENGQLRLYAVT